MVYSLMIWGLLLVLVLTVATGMAWASGRWPFGDR